MTEQKEMLINRKTLALATQIAGSYLTRFAQAQTAFGDDRNYYKVLGYPEQIELDDYIVRYKRQDIASRIVDLPAQDTWKKPPQISEDGNTETDFVKEWNRLATSRDLQLWSKLSRADRLSGIGRYGVLVLGFSQGDLDQPVTPANDLQLLYLRPFSEASVNILETQEDPTDKRFGKPSLYGIDFAGDQKYKDVHWSRVIHFADGKQDSEVYGTPRLEKVFNRLDDIIKLIGGGAEASWLNMRQGTLMRPQEGYDGDSMDRTKLADEISEYAHDPLRMLWLEGVETQPIGRDKVMNVSPPFQVALALISAATGIPQRVLVGSAQGELASAAEDLRQWAGEVAYRQKNYAEPEILRVFIDRMVQYKILPPPGEDGYRVGTEMDGEWAWPPLVEMTEKEHSEIIERKARAVKNLSDPLADYPLDIEEMRNLLGFTGDRPSGIQANEDELLRMMNQVEKKYKRGEITAEEMIQFNKTVWIEIRDLIKKDTP